MIIVVEKLCRTHHNKNLALLNFWKLIFISGRPGRAGEKNSICVSLMKSPGGDIAEHHTLEAVSRSQPLKHNGERALTPATQCQIQPDITVSFRVFLRIFLFSDLLYVFSKTRMFLVASTYFRFVGSTLRISRKGYC